MTQELEQQLSALTSETLTPIVRRAVADDSAEVIEWSFSPVSGEAINPITAGIYKFAGQAQSHEQIIPWSVILKIAQWVDFTGTPLEKGYLNDPLDWNYWKREALAYQSGILEKVQGHLIPVKCLHISEPTDTSVWIWQEEVNEPNRSNWILDRHILAARHFGEFGGAHIGFKPNANDNSWICRQFIRQWATLGVKFGALNELTEQSEFWKHPYTQMALPQFTFKQLQELIANIDSLCNALEKQPQTLSHQDANWTNLFATQDQQGREQTTVIDWSFLGLAAVGEDLGMQTSSNLSNFYVDPMQAKTYYYSALDAYLDGLRQAGWHGNETSVRFGCATAATLRNSIFQVMMLKGLIEDNEEEDENSWHIKLAKRNNLTVEETLIRWGNVVTFLFDLANQARELATQL